MDITYLSDTDDTGYVEDAELHEPVDIEIMSDMYEYPNEVRKVFDRRTSSSGRQTDPKLQKSSAPELIQMIKEVDLIGASIKKCQNINEKHTN